VIQVQDDSTQITQFIFKDKSIIMSNINCSDDYNYIDKRFKSYSLFNDFVDQIEITELDIKSILSVCESKFEIIFNNEINDHNNVNDMKRKIFYPNDEWQQANPVISKPFFSITSKIRKFCETKYPNLVCSKLSLLKSDIGCLEQQPHTDYDVSDKFSATIASESRFCILALMDNTKIVIWNGCHQTSHKAVDIPKGSLFVGRGTLVHSGASCASENLRIHFYLHTKTIESVSFNTYLIKSDYISFYHQATKNIIKWNKLNKRNKREVKKSMLQLTRLRWNK
jgi:hypothetical protein